MYSTLETQTLAQIVTENFQAAPVFEKYGLDFCCKGKRPLVEACREKQIDVSSLLAELDGALKTPASRNDYNEMSPTELVEFIIRVHHTYIKFNAPQILQYLERVATKHGDRYPFMQEVYECFTRIKAEMDQHMAKEERILFPRIKAIDGSEVGTEDLSALRSMIAVMEKEHDEAGSLTENIRVLTGNYAVPEGACTTFRLALASLQAFEEDLHQHVHLENNILFPKVMGRK
jgi:regulator of cell morphogenesis and NO signaling